jgi:hypothetical protein
MYIKRRKQFILPSVKNPHPAFTFILPKSLVRGDRLRKKVNQTFKTINVTATCRNHLKYKDTKMLMRETWSNTRDV